MESCILPLEIIEKILGYVDAETLLNCEDVSPMFAAAVDYIGTKNTWKDYCILEFTRHDIELQIIGKLYPHHPHYDCPRTWRAIYKCWLRLKQITAIKKWNITVLSLARDCSQILQVVTHGNLILALMRYRKKLSSYCKIVAVDERDIVVYKSCRFKFDTLYLTPSEGTKCDANTVLLHCTKCKLIGISPSKASSKRKNYPKIAFSSNKINVFQSNGEYLFFRNSKGLLDKSKCGILRERYEINSATCFVRVICEFSNLYISCGDIYREFITLQSLHSKITCSKFFASVLFLGTDTGMVYGYYCKDKYDVLQLELTNYTWCFCVSKETIVSIDVIVSDEQIGVVCCDSTAIYKLIP